MRYWQRLAVVLGVCLPVPVFAATGLSLPLPATVERLAAGLVPFAEAATIAESDSVAPVEAGRIVLTAREASRARAARAAAPGSVLAVLRPHDDIRPAGRSAGRPGRRPVDRPAVDTPSKPHAPRDDTEAPKAQAPPPSTGEHGGTEAPEPEPEKPEPKPERPEPAPERPEPAPVRPEPEPAPISEVKPAPAPKPTPPPAPEPPRARPENPGKKPELPSPPSEEPTDVGPGNGNAADRPQTSPPRLNQ